MQILYVQSLNFDFRLTAAFTLKVWSALSYSRKNPNRGREVEDREFPGLLKKKHVEIPGVNSKRSGISSSDWEKWVWRNFVEYPKVKFCFL